MTSGSSGDVPWMERLKAKATNNKSFLELSKSVRSTLLERRQLLDSEDKVVLRKCMDKLSECIPVRGTASMAERLEAIARKALGGGLNFMDSPAHGCFYLSTEMFYVEIKVDGNVVKEAKIHHIDGNQTSGRAHQPSVQNCPEIIECLNRADFEEFVKHLDGLMSVYALDKATVSEKSMCWNALSILEQDLFDLYSTYCNSSEEDSVSFVHSTPLGILRPRRGGIPMRLTYFLTPSEIMSQEVRVLSDLQKHPDVGLYVTVALEPCQTPNLLPTSSLRIGMPLTVSNGSALNARFVLKLSKPMVISLAKCNEIGMTTDVPLVGRDVAMAPMMQSVIRNATNNQLNPVNHRGLFVTLPDHQHCYFLTDHAELSGVLVSSIPFTHPSQVQEVLEVLRQQALFNALVESCARIKSVQDLEKCLVFEISTVDANCLTVTFEVPDVDGSSMASIEFSLPSVSELKCSVFSSSNSLLTLKESTIEFITKKTLSIPLVMRSIVKHCQKRVEEQRRIRSVQDARDHANLFSKKSAAAAAVMDMDFGGDDLQQHLGGEAATEVKSEPMDYESSTTMLKSDNTLNACGPQDTAFLPGALRPLKMGTEQSKTSTTETSCAKKDKVDVEPPSTNPSFLIDFDSSKKKAPQKDAAAAAAAAAKVEKFSRSQLPAAPPQSVKPSVSITPVSLYASTSTAVSMDTKKAGIEIIPLGHDSVGSLLLPKPSNSPSRSLKDIRRRLSETDTRRKSCSSAANLSKKRKQHLDDRSSGGSSKSSKSSSFKRSLSSLGGDKLKLSPTLSISKTNLSSASTSGGVEIIPATGLHPSPSSKRDRSPGSAASANKSSGSSSRDGIKLTIKNSPSSSKHRPDHYKSSSSSSPTSKSVSKSYVGGLNKQRTSLSATTSSSIKSSSTSCSSGSKSASGTAHQSSKRDKNVVEVRRIFSGGKSLNTTFQIPKLTSSLSQDVQSQAGGKCESQQSRSLNASPKHVPGGGGTTSPKMYSISGSSKSNTNSPRTSPKLTSISPKHSLGFAMPTTSPNYVAVASPNVSPKQCGPSPSSGMANQSKKVSSKTLHPPSQAFVPRPEASSESSKLRAALPSGMNKVLKEPTRSTIESLQRSSAAFHAATSGQTADNAEERVTSTTSGE